MYYLEGENRPIVPKLSLLKTKDGDPFIGLREVGDINSQLEVSPFEIAGLAIKFSRLKTDADILKFANRHGFLGVKHRTAVRFTEAKTLTEFEYGHEKYMFETVNLWRWHIDYVRKLIRLYNALKTGKDLEDILEVKPYKSPHTKAENEAYEHLRKERAKTRGEKYEPTDPVYEILWASNGHHATYQFKEDVDLGAVAKIMLYHDIREMLEQGITIDFSSIRVDKEATFGFGFVDRKATDYLLAAIYYDLWRMVNNLESVKICPVCERPFTPKRSDAVFCGDACRKKNERELKKMH